MATINVSASSAIQLRGAPGASLGVIRVVASAGFSLSGTPVPASQRTVQVTAAGAIAFRVDARIGAARTVQVSARGSVAFTSRLRVAATRTVAVSALGLFSISGSTATAGLRQVTAWSGLRLTATASETGVLGVTATASTKLRASAAAFREVYRVATTGLALDVAQPTNQFPAGSATSTVAFTAGASAVKGGHDAAARLGLFCRTYASVTIGDGSELSGGDLNAGLRRIAFAPVSGEFPMSFAETSSGVLLLANGVDPMLRWDGLLARAEPAGVSAPVQPITLAGAGIGTLTGMRWAAVRFIDRNGNPSSLSPVSNAVNFGRDALIRGLSVSGGYVMVASPGHGLVSGEVVVIGGVVGPAINGTWPVSVVDADRFLVPVAAQAVDSWTGSGSWTWGIATVVYQNLPAPTEEKVVRRQILRTLDGDASVFYVDVDTFDLRSTSFASTRDDDSLAAQEPVPITAADDRPHAARYAPPPNHKAVVINHLGRVFAAGDVSVTRGNAAATTGSPVVRGIGTAWTAALAGRYLYLIGASRPYEIASCDPSNQLLTLAEPYADPGTTHDSYAIRPAPAERKIVYYSEPGQPEAWPPWNAFAVPDDSDEVVGLSSREGLLWILERRHVYRFTHQDDPSQGSCFLVAYRGVVNNRCLIQADDSAYALDEAGIYAFAGGECVPISTPIQSVFRPGGDDHGLAVDWSADTTLWHAVHDPARDLIRWFVAMVGTDGIHHAICYDTRTKRWWIEQYPFVVSASCVGNLAARRALVGSSARRVLCLGEGSADLVADDVAARGRAVAADQATLTDGDADFPSALVGAPVSIVAGTGAGQQRVIAATSATTLVVDQPWELVPDATSVYQVGGVDWSWRTGWFEYAVETEAGNNRDLSLTYQPTTVEATIDARVYQDHEVVAWDLAIDQDGVSVEAGSDRIAFDLRRRGSRARWSRFRREGHGGDFESSPLWVSVSLGGTQGAEPIRVHQVTINGARPGGDS